MDRTEITPAVAERLVAEQFPQWADLPITRVSLAGWDNVTFRLGAELSIRLPSGEGYVGQVAKEHRWLPFLARELPLPIPEPVALGQPSEVYPWPWSVYRWIDGQPASKGPIADLVDFASEVAEFLAALYAIDGSDGPPPGQHSASRGGPVARWDTSTREVIEQLADELDAKAATEVWEAALASTWDRAPVWVHGDVAASNLLVDGGSLSAVIDFGCSAVGDPACDLVMAWTFFDADSAEAFRQRLPFDDATWTRARGWALWKALVTYGEDSSGMGWRHSPREVIELCLADHPPAHV